MSEQAFHAAAAELFAQQIAADVQDIQLGQEETKRRLRPILTHLNADTSWLLSVPVPRGVEHVMEGGTSRRYLHLVFDPWFNGTQEDVHGWFSTQWHQEESKYQTLEEVDELIATIEELPSKKERCERAASFEEAATPSTDDLERTNSRSDGCMQSLIDAIVVSHEFTDHMHEATLRSASPSIPIFAPQGKATDLLHTWSHFTTVIPISLTPSPSEEPDWRKWCPQQMESEGLKWTTWLKITRLMAPEKSMIGYHEGVLFTFPRPATLPGDYPNLPLPNPAVLSRTPDLESGLVEAIIYTPHGLPPSAVKPLVTNKEIKTLALLHGEHDIRLAGSQLNLGEKNGFEVVRETRARYWVATHDEVKHGSGLVSWFLSRTVGKRKETGEEDRAAEMEKELDGKVRCRTIENGGMLVLE